jgi:hypothetical protein
MSAPAWLLKLDEGDMGTLTPLGLSLWLGRTVEEIQAYRGRCEELPAEWWFSARPRAREAAAHVDSYDPIDILRYWADKDLAADVLPVEDGLLLVDR